MLHWNLPDSHRRILFQVQRTWGQFALQCCKPKWEPETSFFCLCVWSIKLISPNTPGCTNWCYQICLALLVFTAATSGLCYTMTLGSGGCCLDILSFIYGMESLTNSYKEIKGMKCSYFHNNCNAMDQFIIAYFYNAPWYLWQFYYFTNIMYFSVICRDSDRSAGCSGIIS